MPRKPNEAHEIDIRELEEILSEISSKNYRRKNKGFWGFLQQLVRIPDYDPDEAERLFRETLININKYFKENLRLKEPGESINLVDLDQVFFKDGKLTEDFVHSLMGGLYASLSVCSPKEMPTSKEEKKTYPTAVWAASNALRYYNVLKGYDHLMKKRDIIVNLKNLNGYKKFENKKLIEALVESGFNEEAFEIRDLLKGILSSATKGNFRFSIPCLNSLLNLVGSEELVDFSSIINATKNIISDFLQSRKKKSMEDQETSTSEIIEEYLKKYPKEKRAEAFRDAVLFIILNDEGSEARQQFGRLATLIDKLVEDFGLEGIVNEVPNNLLKIKEDLGIENTLGESIALVIFSYVVSEVINNESGANVFGREILGEIEEKAVTEQPQEGITEIKNEISKGTVRKDKIESVIKIALSRIEAFLSEGNYDMALKLIEEIKGLFSVSGAEKVFSERDKEFIIKGIVLAIRRNFANIPEEVKVKLYESLGLSYRADEEIKQILEEMKQNMERLIKEAETDPKTKIPLIGEEIMSKLHYLSKSKEAIELFKKDTQLLNLYKDALKKVMETGYVTEEYKEKLREIISSVLPEMLTDFQQKTSSLVKTSKNDKKSKKDPFDNSQEKLEEIIFPQPEEPKETEKQEAPVEEGTKQEAPVEERTKQETPVEEETKQEAQVEEETKQEIPSKEEDKLSIEEEKEDTEISIENYKKFLEEKFLEGIKDLTTSLKNIKNKESRKKAIEFLKETIKKSYGLDVEISNKGEIKSVKNIERLVETSYSVVLSILSNNVGDPNLSNVSALYVREGLIPNLSYLRQAVEEEVKEYVEKYVKIETEVEVGGEFIERLKKICESIGVNYESVLSEVKEAQVELASSTVEALTNLNTSILGFQIDPLLKTQTSDETTIVINRTLKNLAEMLYSRGLINEQEKDYIQSSVTTFVSSYRIFDIATKHVLSKIPSLKSGNIFEELFNVVKSNLEKGTYSEINTQELADQAYSHFVSQITATANLMKFYSDFEIALDSESLNKLRDYLKNNKAAKSLLDAVAISKNIKTITVQKLLEPRKECKTKEKLVNALTYASIGLTYANNIIRNALSKSDTAERAKEVLKEIIKSEYPELKDEVIEKILEKDILLAYEVILGKNWSLALQSRMRRGYDFVYSYGRLSRYAIYNFYRNLSEALDLRDPDLQNAFKNIVEVFENVSEVLYSPAFYVFDPDKFKRDLIDSIGNLLQVAKNKGVIKKVKDFDIISKELSALAEAVAIAINKLSIRTDIVERYKYISQDMYSYLGTLLQTVSDMIEDPDFSSKIVLIIQGLAPFYLLISNGLVVNHLEFVSFVNEFGGETPEIGKPKTAAIEVSDIEEIINYYQENEQAIEEYLNILNSADDPVSMFISSQIYLAIISSHILTSDFFLENLEFIKDYYKSDKKEIMKDLLFALSLL